MESDFKPKVKAIKFLGTLDNVYRNYLIQLNDVQFARVSYSTYTVLKLLDGTNTIIEVINKCRELNINVEAGDVNKLIQSNLIPNNLLVNQKKVKVKKKGRQRFLIIKIPIFPQKLVKMVARFFVFLIHPSLMISLSLIGILLNCFVGWQNRALFLSYHSPVNNVFYFPLVLFLMGIFHEFGHAAASLYYKTDPGPIGIGIFMVFPVFWTDLNSIWKIDREKRVIADIAGLYFQVIISIFLIIFHFVFQADFLMALILWNCFAILYSLIPIYRLDGYWILSDLLGIPNLLSEVFLAVKQAVTCKKPKILNYLHGWSRLGFFLYLLFTLAILPLFLKRIIFMFFSLLHHWPGKIAQLIRLLQTWDFTWPMLAQLFRVLFDLAKMGFFIFIWLSVFILPLVKLLWRQGSKFIRKAKTRV